ncbi:GMC oxidoreductase [Tsukamurella pulmonis]|uniref:Choline dehydrogenase n=2 Tax=Tsukamurella pulmonis TaxID=47312 RepID=A0A1H1BW89_9ACTN|nr:GMC family oxidoreductase N-terminal domain-containing protein [Tsukamurella pulmonis]KXO90172.1 GMC oxidoreductase [Tsukamurella pulmonis]BDD84271.1 GMC oxidoreductase [Tsukamurella pulmonis]SDQ56212.1 Choline dehydrogenase [Tsukamurella pulmonis]SUP24569.1 Cholesterol oxidase [Tsukamurella pulmonis]
MSFTFDARRRATLTAVVDTFVASVPREDDPTGFWAVKGSDLQVDAAVEEYLLGHLPEEQLEGLGELLDTAALVGMKNQPQAIREVILANLSGIAPEAGLAVASLCQLSTMIAYGLMDEQGRNPLWAGMGYPGPVSAPPATPKTITTIAPTAGETLTADVVIVGSGSGGGVTAAELARAGKKVIVVEGGSYRNEADFVQNELFAYQTLFLRGGFFPTADGTVMLAAGATVGGGSTVNWSNSLRTPDVVRKEWADAGLEDALGPEFDEHLDAVFSRMGCNSEVATQNGPHRMLAAGAAGLGYSYRLADLNVNPDRYDVVRSAYSGMGDQTGAKNGTMRTFLQDASDAGARLLPNTRIATVTTVDAADGVRTTTGVEGVHTDPATGAQTPVRIEAPTVVVAAGSLETPALLLRSGIGGPAVGQSLRLHPATLVSGIYDEPMAPWEGPAMAGVMNEFADADAGYGFLIECVQHLPGLFASIVPWLGGERHKELAAQYGNRADWVVLVKDRGTGTVTIGPDGEAVHTYPFDDELDRKHLREGIAVSIRMQEAAGAQQIYLSGQRFEPWRRGDDLEAYIAKVNEIPIGPGGTPVFSAHQMCSAPLGADPATSVANPSGELHDTRGVWIADASGMPTCSGVNPMITTMALAHRTATNLLAADA